MRNRYPRIIHSDIVALAVQTNHSEAPYSRAAPKARIVSPYVGTSTVERAAIIQDLGIESDDVVNYCFPKT